MFGAENLGGAVLGLHVAGDLSGGTARILWGFSTSTCETSELLISKAPNTNIGIVGYMLTLCYRCLR